MQDRFWHEFHEVAAGVDGCGNGAGMEVDDDELRTKTEGWDDEDIFWAITRAQRNKSTDILPAGFPIPVDENSGEVCEPALLFLYENYVEKKGCDISLNTLLAYCHDLKEWWRYLEEFEFTWTSVIDQNIKAFLDTMGGTISPETGEPYSTRTINRRGFTVGALYKWGKEKGYAAADTPDEGLLKNGTVGNHTRKSKKEEKQHVSVMRRDQAKKIFQELGPLPSEWVRIYAALYSGEPDALQKDLLERSWSSRDRLGEEIALNLGLRISEVVSLQAQQFSFYPKDLVENRAYSITVRGKGGKSRKINIAGRMIREIRTYIDGERKLTMRECGVTKCSKLLVNPVGSGRYAGRGTSNRTLERRFSAACLSCGESELREVFVPVNMEDGVVAWKVVHKLCPLFVVHDSRHTYAVWTYYILKKNGDKEPWLYIQAQLGHAHLITTQDTYLKATSEFEASVSDLYMDDMWCDLRYD